MPTYPWIEFPLCALSIFAPLVVVYCRLAIGRTIKRNGTVEERAWGIGVRMIQVIAILALKGKLTGGGTGMLLGAVVGYALGGIAGPVPKDGN